MTEPIVTLRGSDCSGPISSLCFLRGPENQRIDYLSTQKKLHKHPASTSTKFKCHEILHREDIESTELLETKNKIFSRKSSELDFLVSGGVLASCNTNNGYAYLWDISSRRVVSKVLNTTQNYHVSKEKYDTSKFAARGLKICRFRSENFLFHSRGNCGGLVTIHDIERSCSNSTSSSVVSSYETSSITFCAASTCIGDTNLIVIPYSNEPIFAVYDTRMSHDNKKPVVKLHGSLGVSPTRNELMRGKSTDDGDKYGMITSLSMIASSPSRPIVVCGMESGDIIFHDLGLTSKFSCNLDQSCKSSEPNSNYFSPTSFSSIKVGNNPILCLDVICSSRGIQNSKSKNQHSSTPLASSSYDFLTVAGSAGDNADLSSRPKCEQNTIHVIKTSGIFPPQHTHSEEGSKTKTISSSTLEAAFSTCRLGDSSFGGKPGVGTCQWFHNSAEKNYHNEKKTGDRRTDSKKASKKFLFCVGGWDKRARVFSYSLTSKQKNHSNSTVATNNEAIGSRISKLEKEKEKRTKKKPRGKLITILKEHTDSVTAVDWYNQTIGERKLLATGSNDGNIKIWNPI